MPNSPTVRARIAAALMLLTVGALAACNTVEGAGQDVKDGGQDLSNTAERAKP